MIVGPLKIGRDGRCFDEANHEVGPNSMLERRLAWIVAKRNGLFGHRITVMEYIDASDWEFDGGPPSLMRIVESPNGRERWCEPWDWHRELGEMR
jgi:hypothetical protein